MPSSFRFPLRHGASPATATSRRTLLQQGAALAGSAALPTLWAGSTLAQERTGTDPEAGAVRGGTLSGLIHPEPPSLAFFINSATPIVTVTSKIFDGLLDYGPDLQPRPQLAERWSVSADGKSITFFLRQGVKWHDGKPFGAADVKFSVEEVWVKYSPAARRIFQNLQRVDTPDEHTVVLVLSQPAPVALSALYNAAAPILPRHLYAGTDIPNNPYNNKPVGTGPFVFKEWKRGEHIVLERNPHYWLQGRPYLDGIVWKVTPDAASRANALETGAAQYGERNPVTFADAGRLAKLPHLVVSQEGYNGYAALAWLEFNLRDPLFAKRPVRQAIAHAIDRDLLTKTVWGGYAVPATGPIPTALKSFYTADTPQYPFDPRKAERLLDEAGYPRKADGWRFALTHDWLPYGDDYRRTGEFVRQALRRIGIDATLGSQDLPTWTRKVFADYKFQVISSWGTVGLDPQVGVEQHYWSKAESKGTPWFNASGYANPEADRVIESAQSETDPRKRQALYQELQRLVQRDLPLLNLFEFRWFGVWDKRLRNVTDTHSHSRSNFARVWFEPKS